MRRLSLKSGILTSIWIIAVCVGLILLTRFETAPGAEGSTPSGWPSESQLRRDDGRPNLVMFVHPRCPCSRASIEELDSIMAHCGDKLAAQVVFFVPAKNAAEWTSTDLWKSASAIPGVRVEKDTDGREEALFGAETSGYTVLYDAAGKLVFRGGLTPSRGHAGDSAGRDAIIDFITLGQQIDAKTFVYGCPLQSGNAASR